MFMNGVKISIYKVFATCFLMFLSSFLCFAMLYYSKASVVFASGNDVVSLETKNRIEANLNLDKPLVEQYKIWLLKVFKGDFGTSLISGEKIFSLIVEPLKNTFILTIISLFILFFLSIVLALFCVVYQDSFIDKIINFFTLSFFALPPFALALIHILIFGFFLKILPISGVSDIGFEDDLLNRFEHLILPISTLVLSHLAIFLRIARASFIESLNQVFILNAFARGLSKIRVYGHFILKYSLGVIVSYFGASALSFIMGAYVVESIFSYNGIGFLMIQSIIFKDYPVAMFLIMLSILMVNFFILISALLVKIINPRLNYA